MVPPFRISSEKKKKMQNAQTRGVRHPSKIPRRIRDEKGFLCPPPLSFSLYPNWMKVRTPLANDSQWRDKVQVKEKKESERPRCYHLVVHTVA